MQLHFRIGITDHLSIILKRVLLILWSFKNGLINFKWTKYQFDDHKSRCHGSINCQVVYERGLCVGLINFKVADDDTSDLRLEKIQSQPFLTY